MMFKIPELIELLSAGGALYPGDVIATGTPAGVGAGMDPPEFLKAGDEVVVDQKPDNLLAKDQICQL